MTDFALRLADGTLVEVLDGTLTLPRIGLWRARLTLHEDTTPAEGQPAAVLVARETGGPEVFTGTLGPCRLHEGRVFVELVGAAALERQVTEGVHYASAPTSVKVAELVTDLVAAAGVELADGVTGGLAGLTTPRWTRMAGESWARALERVAERYGRSWRVQDDGRVWIGEDTWPVVNGEPFVEWDDTEVTTLHVVYDDTRWRPGTVVLGKRIVRADYHANGRAHLAYEEDGDELFAAAVTRFSRSSPYSVIYQGEVIAQHDDEGTVSVHILDGPIEDLPHVPFEVGLEGARIVLPDHARVRVAFEGGRPDGAFAFLRPIAPDGRRGIARINDHAQAGTISMVGTPTGITVTYTAPNGVTTSGFLAAVDSISLIPITFTGAFAAQLEAIIDTASGEAFLR